MDETQKRNARRPRESQPMLEGMADRIYEKALLQTTHSEEVFLRKVLREVLFAVNSADSQATRVFLRRSHAWILSKVLKDRLKED